MSTDPCSKCGQVHAGCTAHKKAGGPCGNSPVQFLSVCRMHGGAGANAKAKQARLRAEAEAQREMDKIAKLRTLGDLELTPAQEARSGEIVVRHLRLLKGGAA